MLDEQDKSTLIGALQYIIRRLQMDIDDGSRPDQWSMEDLVRVANDALKAQQPAQDHDCALKRGAVMCRDCDLDVIEKATAVDAEGLPPLPEPVGVLHRGEGGEWSFSTGGHLRSLYAQPIGEHKLHTVDQVRRAQREAMAVERERWMKLCKDAAQRYFSGGFGEAAGACTHLHAQGSAIRQGASHD